MRHRHQILIRFVQDEDRYILRSHVRNTHAKKLVMLGGKPVTFSILVFAIKRVKKLVMLGGETCGISHSRLHNKTCQELVMLGGETCDISRSGVHKTCKAGYPVGW